MRAILGEFSFEVLKLEGVEELFFGFSFKLTLNGYYESSVFPIGEVIQIGGWKGRIVAWLVEESGAHNDRFFSCEVVSSFQYFCSKENYCVYKNLDYKSIIQKIIGHMDLKLDFKGRSGAKYTQIVQYADSDQDFIKHLCRNEGVIFWIDSKEDMLIFSDSQTWSGNEIFLNFGRFQSEDTISIFKSFIRLSSYYNSSIFTDSEMNYISESGRLYSAQSWNSRIRVGSILILGGETAGQRYKIFKVKHIFDENGYRNEFILLEDSDKILFEKHALPDLPGPQLAKILATESSSVELVFDWCEDGVKASVAQLFAFEGQGAFFVPQPGEAVLVLFEAGSRSNCFVVGSLYTNAFPASHLSSTIKSIKTRSNYDETKCVELSIDASNSLLKLSSAGGILEEIGEDKLVEIKEGSLKLCVGKNNLLKMQKSLLSLNIIDGQMMIYVPEVSVFCSSLTLNSDNLTISGKQVEISSVNLIMQSKTTEISSPELKIRSAKVDIS